MWHISMCHAFSSQVEIVWGDFPSSVTINITKGISFPHSMTFMQIYIHAHIWSHSQMRTEAYFTYAYKTVQNAMKFW